MNYQIFLENLVSARLLTPINLKVSRLIYAQLEIEEKNEIIKIFAIYLSLVEDGNTCILLDKENLISKWIKKCESQKVLLEESNDVNNISVIDEIINDSKIVINDYLDKVDEKYLSNIIGEKKLFIINNNWLYARKYYLSKMNIEESIKRLYQSNTTKTPFDYKVWLDPKSKFSLSVKQEEAVIKGIDNNLIITGGPGTGKTTSILYVLLGLLTQNNDYRIYLTAPSGKAASRMKESILKSLSFINPSKKNDKVIGLLNLAEEYTIHRLLETDFKTNDFNYNYKNQFNKNSIFIIDEASMIDICIFDSLLQAIPTGARVFILGDKNQLPSVESGAVLSDLLNADFLKDNIVELDESIRFRKGTDIYNLAKEVNENGELPINDTDWKDLNDFEIQKEIGENKPIFYYKNSVESKLEKEQIENVVKKWGTFFYDKLQSKASDLDESNNNYLDELFDIIEDAKILCAEKESSRGVKILNKVVLNKVIDRSKTTTVINHYAGQIMMINKNNKLLDLYNGDTGITVTFKGDNTLYFMVKKSSKIVSEDKKLDDKIFKLGEYIFYPFRLININEIEYAYAITIHKSQGSDYKNILVFLPKKDGHPLLNRQIVYTAITRTKGNTYIISSMNHLIKAKENVLVRDTNIFKN